MSELLETYTQKRTKVQADQEWTEAYSEATRANKIGKNLANQTMKMVETGQIEKEPGGFSYGLDKFIKGAWDRDLVSTNMALNAELKQRGLPVEASLRVESVRSMDPGETIDVDRLRIDSIDGKPVQELNPKPKSEHPGMNV